jgi:hypothetical protein
MSGNWWNTIDFRPAPPGWRVVFLWDKQREVLPIAGWLIQERYSQGSQDPYPLSDALGDDEKVFGRRRRVIAGTAVKGYGWVVQAIDDNLDDVADVWRILGPGEPEATDEEEKEERAARAAKKPANP